MKEERATVNKRSYEIPWFAVTLCDPTDVIATSGITVLPSDDDEGFGPLIPIGCN